MANQLSRTAPPAKHATVHPIAATPELPSAVPLMALSTGFWAFKTLAAAHELDLFSRLAGGAGTTVAELAEALSLHQRPAEMLLTGCAALGLLEKTGGRYRNTSLSETYLVRGKPYYFGGFVQMLDKRLYPGWGRLTEALRTNGRPRGTRRCDPRCSTAKIR
ncbi:methyltransferase dimerization domain-containing protein [Mesorhizobium sp.]|uniref:methyltransferase family protein n=1 Tax=Mesorhizobium sp. TaxID=1871066 RepID=UPI002579D76A|nr:methyltransferase dimerization domain-containing protein [Mesorhizobium sp.]